MGRFYSYRYQNLIPFLVLLVAFFAGEVSMQDSTTSTSTQIKPVSATTVQNISSADNSSTGNPDDDNFRARRPRFTTTTEDPLLDATLDPRLETDAFNLVDIMMLNDFLGSSVLAGLEMHQMSRMANIPLPYERIGPAPPLPPVPSGPAPAPSPAAPNLLPLYLSMLNNQARPQYGYHSSEGAGSYNGGGSGGSDDPAGSNCDMQDEAESGICSDPSDLVTLVPLQDYLLAKGQSGIYRIAYNGTPLGEEKGIFGFEKQIPTASFITPAKLYLFFGNKYKAMHPATLTANKTVFTEDDNILARVTTIFRAKKLPVKGIIQSSDGMIIFFSEKSFVMHARNGSSFGEDSFRPLSKISGAPARIDSAFTTDYNNSSFLYRQGWLYQLQLPDLKIIKKIPFRSDNPENTWLKCTEITCS